MLDAPFRVAARRGRFRIGEHNYDEWTLTYNTNPARRFYEKLSFSPSEFYGGTRRQVNAACRRARSRVSCRARFSSIETTWTCHTAPSRPTSPFRVDFRAFAARIDPHAQQHTTRRRRSSRAACASTGSTGRERPSTSCTTASSGLIARGRLPADGSPVRRQDDLHARSHTIGDRRI